MTKSAETEAKNQRYNRVEKEADKWGRLIAVRRLKPNEERRIKGMTSDLAGFEDVLSEFDDVVGEDGKTIQVRRDKPQVIKIPLVMPYLVAAMVCEIDGIPFTFPQTRRELDAVYDRLDAEGIEAALKAFGKLEASQATSEEEVVEEAKN